MKKSTIILLWGAITAIACILYTMILNMQGISLSGWRYVNWLIVLLFFTIGTLQYRNKANGGYLSYGKGYVVSLLFTSIVIVLSLISLIITLQVEPDLGDKLLNELHIQLVNKGLNEDQIDMIMKFYAKGFTPAGMMLFSFFANIFMGLICGLISAGIAAKKKPVFDDATTETPADNGAQVN